MIYLAIPSKGVIRIDNDDTTSGSSICYSICYLEEDFSGIDDFESTCEASSDDTKLLKAKVKSRLTVSRKARIRVPRWQRP